LEDDKILQIFHENPGAALGILYDKYFEYLSKEVFFILKDEQDTKDVIQDLFLSLWKNKDLLNHINLSLKQYLKKAAYNKSINKIKTRVQFADWDDDESPLEVEEQHNKIVAEELESSIIRAIDELPIKCRTVFILSRFEEKTYKEIAIELNISQKTVENQIGKALKILRNKIIDK
jgi:RNA polymerase sigma-70 factor, ECF subfamily